MTSTRFFPFRVSSPILGLERVRLGSVVENLAITESALCPKSAKMSANPGSNPDVRRIDSESL
jgi:hypothetical protein